jgi:hypothetical protein
MSTVHLSCGLGNQLFQLAFLAYVERKTGGRVFLGTLASPATPHSTAQYFETILREWRVLYDPTASAPRVVREVPSMRAQEWDLAPGACYVGYFQRHEYADLVRDAFVAKLRFDPSVALRYPDIARKTFIHVRGGDYKTSALHDVPLAAYFARCMDLTPLKEFVVFTNDPPLARRMFPSVPVIDESEVDTLYLMSRCGACICANSSFSWWGAYLAPDRPIYMPSRWYTTDGVQGSYHFPGVTVVDV